MLHHLHPRPHTHEAQNLRFSTLKNHDKESTMQRRLLTLLCLGLLSTAGCSYDPAYGPPSVSVGVGPYTVEHDYWYDHPRRDNWYNDWPHRRWPHRYHYD